MVVACLLIAWLLSLVTRLRLFHYRDSEDTLLMILKETLRESGIEADTVLKTEPSTEVEPGTSTASVGADAVSGALPAPAPAPAAPAAPIPIVLSAPGPVAAEVPLLPAGVSAPAPAPAPAPVSARAVGGRPLQLPPASGAPVGMDPTVERTAGAAPPPPPPMTGFRRS